MSFTHPTVELIREAHARIRPYIHRTPVLSSRTLNEIVGSEVYFKCENFQKVGAFKARGACNAVMSLDGVAAAKGVVTHSSGNHGAALAWASRLRGIRATVVVPENAPDPKKRAIAAYGATIVYCAPTVAARESAVEKLIAEHGYTLIHPFDNEAVIAGQGTAVLELLEEHPHLDIVVSPLGGGGLLSGTAIAAHGIRSDIGVFGAEPRGADDGFRSLASGDRVREMTPDTICDGLRTVLSDRTFDVIRNHVAGIGVASDENVVKAMRLIWERLKIVVEPSACPPLAALLEDTIAARGKRVGIILSGGNLDLDRLPWAIAV